MRGCRRCATLRLSMRGCRRCATLRSARSRSARCMLSHALYRHARGSPRHPLRSRLAVAGGIAAAVQHDHNELDVKAVCPRSPATASRWARRRWLRGSCRRSASRAGPPQKPGNSPASGLPPVCTRRRRRSAPRPPCRRRFSRREFTPTLRSESHTRNAGPWFNLCPQRVSGVCRRKSTPSTDMVG